MGKVGGSLIVGRDTIFVAGPLSISNDARRIADALLRMRTYSRREIRSDSGKSGFGPEVYFGALHGCISVRRRLLGRLTLTSRNPRRPLRLSETGQKTKHFGRGALTPSKRCRQWLARDQSVGTNLRACYQPQLPGCLVSTVSTILRLGLPGSATGASVDR